MASVVRTDLLERLTKGMVTLNGERRESAMQRCIRDRGPVTLVVCLGLGRCIFPADGDLDGKRTCPFCMQYDERAAHTDKHAHRAAEQFVKGH